MIQYRPTCTTLEYWEVVPKFPSALHLDVQNKVDRKREPIIGYVEAASRRFPALLVTSGAPR